MRVIKPEVITEGVLTSSSIPEPDASVGEVEWEADRFSGLDISLAIPASATVLDIKLDSGFFYVLASQSFSPPIMYKINLSGSLVSSYNLSTIGGSPLTTSSFTISGLYIYSVYGDKIQRNNISNGSYDSIYDISTEISDSSAIGFYDSKFFICEGSTGLIKRFSLSMAYEDFSFKADGGLNSSGSIEVIENLINVTQGGLSRVLRFTLGGELVSTIKTDHSLAGVTYSNDLLQSIATNGQKEIRNYTYDLIYNGFYKVDDKVIKTSTHTQYQCTIATADDPEVGVDKIPQTWVKIGATNKWKVFDEAVNTQSTDDSPLVMEFLPGQNVTSIAGFNLSGASTVNITVTDPVAGEVYNKDIALISQSNVVDWFTYYWSPIISRRFFIATDLPPYINATIKVTITGSGSVGIGALVFGSLITIGEANYGTSVAMQDLSRLSEDDFGNVTVTRRESRKLTNYDVTIENARKDYVYNVLDDLRTIPSVWIGEGSQNDITVTYGYHYDLLINIDYPTICSTTLQVRGLV